MFRFTYHIAPIPDQVLVRLVGRLDAQRAGNVKHLAPDALSVRGEVLYGYTRVEWSARSRRW